MDPAIKAIWKKVIDKARADAAAKAGAKRFANLQGFAKATLKRRADEKTESPTAGAGAASPAAGAGAGSGAPGDTRRDSIMPAMTKRATERREGMASYVGCLSFGKAGSCCAAGMGYGGGVSAAGG